MLKCLMMPLILLIIIFGYGCMEDKENELAKDSLLIIQNEEGIELRVSENLEGLSLSFNENLDKNSVEVSGVDFKIIKDNKIALAGGIEKGELVVSIKNLKIEDIDLNSIETIKTETVQRVLKKDSDITMEPILLGDFNNDGEVALTDYVEFVDNYFTDSSMTDFEGKYDIGPARKQDWGLWKDIYAYAYPDGKVGLLDFVIFAGNYFKEVPVFTGEGTVTGLFNITDFQAGVVKVFIDEEYQWEEIKHIDIPASLAQLSIIGLPIDRRLAIEIDIPEYYIKKYYDIRLSSDKLNYDLGDIILKTKGTGIVRGNFVQDLDNGWVNVHRRIDGGWEYLMALSINTVDDAFEIQGLPIGEEMILEIYVDGYHVWRDERLIIADTETDIFTYPEDIELRPFGDKQIQITIENPGLVDGVLSVDVYQILSETEKIHIMDRAWFEVGMSYFEVDGLETGEYLLEIEGEGFDLTTVMTGIGEEQEFAEILITLTPGIEITAPIKNILAQDEIPHFEWRSSNMMTNSYAIGVISGDIDNMDEIYGPESFNVALMTFNIEDIQIEDELGEEIRTFAWDYMEKAKTTTEQIYDFALPLEARTPYMYMVIGFEETYEELQVIMETNINELHPISLSLGEENFFMRRSETIRETSIQINNPSNIEIPEGSLIKYFMFKIPEDLKTEPRMEEALAIDQQIEVSSELYIGQGETPPEEGENTQIIMNVSLMDPILKETVTDQYGVLIEIEIPGGGYEDEIVGAALLEFTGIENILTEPIQVDLGIVPEILMNLIEDEEDEPHYSEDYMIFDTEDSFRAELTTFTTTVDFDVYPNGEAVPTGYDPSGVVSEFTLSGNEWSEWGVTFSTPSGQEMSTVSTTEFPEGEIHQNHISAPNGLTIGQPPFVGDGVIHSDFTEDSLFINFPTPVDGVGLYFIDSSGVVGEKIELYDINDNMIGDIPADYSINFIGIVSEIPIAKVKIYENANDGDDVAYDNLIFGVK